MINQCGDIQIAEDALQTACLKASRVWPSKGIPDSPEGWLYTVAKRSLLDVARHDQHRSQPHLQATVADSLSATESSDEGSQPIPDERLKLIFTCCHPALNNQAQVALTLKTLCGLTSREIARAYLVSESTMQQRLVRAKKKIRHAGIAYRVPEPHELDERMEAVLETLYLIFNESYTAFEGQTLSRADLGNEAVRLARLLHQLLPDPRSAGLLALMLMHQARDSARSTSDNPYICLEDQDRGLWDQSKISEGRNLVLTALAQAKPDKYQIQAAISAVHCEAQSWDETDWPQILLLYSTLYHLEPNPVVKLNALVALARSGELDSALEQMRALSDDLTEYQPFHAAMADLLATAGDVEGALSFYESAIKLSNNQAERQFLQKRKELITPK